MLKYYKTIDGYISEIEEIEDGCWINLVAPDEDEIDEIVEKVKLDRGFVSSALDEEETSHVEVEEDQTLIIVDIPVAEKEGNNLIYMTMPLGIIITPNYFVTLCLKENTIIKEFSTGMVKNCKTEMKTRFLMQIFLKIATRFLQYLKQIDKVTQKVEQQLHKSMQNRELIQLLGLEKSLVYFSTSLKSNEVTMEKILRGRVVKLYEDDQDLLEDVIIENKQAIEMSNIYSSILSGMMDAFASIISNNLNIVMKFLAAMTILMSVPTIIASVYGMNVEGLPYKEIWWFPIIIAVIAMVVIGGYFWKKDMF